MGHMKDHIGVVVGIHRADPLIHARPLPDILRRQSRSIKRFIDIGGDGAGLVDGKISMPEDRHAIERMQSQMLRLAHDRLGRESIGDIFVRQDQTDDVDIGASRETVDD